MINLAVLPDRRLDICDCHGGFYLPEPTASYGDLHYLGLPRSFTGIGRSPRCLCGGGDYILDAEFSAA